MTEKKFSRLLLNWIVKVNRTSCLGQYAFECNLVLFSHAEVATEKHESESVMKRSRPNGCFAQRSERENRKQIQHGSTATFICFSARAARCDFAALSLSVRRFAKLDCGTLPHNCGLSA